jgi:transposase
MEQKEQMIMGCDISKDKIDLCLLEKATGKIIISKSYANNSSGHQRIVKQLSDKDNCLVVLEATGNYHLRFISCLAAYNLCFAVINPLVLKRFAQMKMLRTKTDKLDAFIIAQYGKEQSPKAHQMPSKEQQELKALITVLNNLLKQRTQTKNLLHSQLLLPGNSIEFQKPIKKVLFTLNKQIQAIQKSIDKIIVNNFEHLKELITSIKGIGDKTAQGVIAYLGDLKSYSSYKQVASYVGINPAIKQSGQSLNKTSGISKQGNAVLRTLFYMSALSAIRVNKACKAFYIRLLQKGKKKKTALIAVANKLIKQLFAIIKKNIFYLDDYYHPKFT